MEKAAGQYNELIKNNARQWETRALLRLAYERFYKMIAHEAKRDINRPTFELGSGGGYLKTVMPDCVLTDFIKLPGIDRVENAYSLNFESGSVANLILFDVWHHLEYPGSALSEFRRVLAPGGRVIIFDPALSVLGCLIYGLFHREPLGIFKKISWLKPASFVPERAPYYSAQGNAFRIFRGEKYESFLRGWKLLKIKRLAAISYLASGGYSGPQLCSEKFFPCLLKIDRVLDRWPLLFASRMLVVLEKDGRPDKI